MLPNWNLLVGHLKRSSKQSHLTRWLKELVANWAAGRKGLAPLPLAPVALHHHGGCRVPFSTAVAPATLLWCPTLPFPTALGGCHHQLLVLVKGRSRGPKSTQLPPSEAFHLIPRGSTLHDAVLGGWAPRQATKGCGHILRYRFGP